MRKELSEGQKPEEGQKEDNRDPKDPRSPEDERAGGATEDEPGQGPPPENAVPAWAVSLPPQIRDAVIRGDFEMVPNEYRDLVRRYHLWLLEQERRATRGR